MRLIAAVDNNWGIGCDGKLLAHISDDMRRFHAITDKKTVIMGRKTLESFPNKRPLSGRKNIVLSSNPKYKIPGISVVHNIHELFHSIKRYNSDQVYVIGGCEIYKQLARYCDIAFITKIDYVWDNADVYCPNLDELSGWEILEENVPVMEYAGLSYKFLTYINGKVEQYV